MTLSFEPGMLIGWASCLFLYYLNGRLKSRRLAIVNRWLMGIFMSFALASIVQYLEWLSRPLPLLALTFLVLWFVLETFFNWYTIRVINCMGGPIFPKFKEVEKAHPWPNTPAFLRFKRFLSSAGFTQIASLEAPVVPKIKLPSWVFENEDKSVRLQIVIFPKGRGLDANFAFYSRDTDGKRWVSNNVSTAFGGFYPEHWKVKRRPLLKNPEKLYRKHMRWVKQVSLRPFEGDALEELEEERQMIEAHNVNMGFVYPRAQRLKYGSLTPLGRYRLWKETWLLKYLGIVLHG